MPRDEDYERQVRAGRAFVESCLPRLLREHDIRLLDDPEWIEDMTQIRWGLRLIVPNPRAGRRDGPRIEDCWVPEAMLTDVRRSDLKRLLREFFETL